ncbi:hypothetical protein TDB9533_00683 [Thalassocella blandensis]|nr:hypothetical protein TDB9533_00683 [Thalassocella blandensis]
MRDYHKQVIRRVLDLSVDKYGAYSLDFATKKASVVRVRNEVAFGDHYQIDFSAMILENETVRAKTHQIRFPIFDETLGLRQLIIHKSDLEKFRSLKTLDEFISLRAGQGEKWQDIGIYNDAGIEVIESINYESLFPMLAQKRFDYLPLGIIEADAALNNEKQFLDTLQIVDNVYVYYPIPFYLNVTKRYTGLVNRINYGVKKFEESGEMKAMFQSYFKQQFSSLDPSKSLVFVVRNPELSKSDNEHIIAKVMNSYFTKKSNLFYLPSQKFDGTNLGLMPDTPLQTNLSAD